MSIGFQVGTNRATGEFFYKTPTAVDGRTVIAYVEYPEPTNSDWLGTYQEAFVITDAGDSAHGAGENGRYDLFHLTWRFDDKNWSASHYAHSNDYTRLTLQMVAAIASETDK